MTRKLAAAIALLMCACCALAQSERVLYAFKGPPDGAGPMGGLVEDGQGNFYGATQSGGGPDCGTVFELKRAAGAVTVTTIWAFGNVSAADGCTPQGGVIADAVGNLYGTTLSGGAYGSGTAFEVSPDGSGGWTEKVLWSFGGVTGNAQDGFSPRAGLTMDTVGKLYGTTLGGGGSATGGGDGTVFELTPNGDASWREAVLHSFVNRKGHSDGLNPYASVTLDSAGNIYGTTADGVSGGGGTVFALEKSAGWKETEIYQFQGVNDGEIPETSVIFAGADHLLGTASEGGDSSGGVVFELVKTAGGWQQTVLHAFGSIPNDGVHPNSGLSAYGNHYYGTTMGWPSDLHSNCGYFNCGTVYELTQTAAGWSYSVLYTFFSPSTGGFDDWYGEAITAGREIYGTTNIGGPYNRGVVFEITP